MKKPCFSKTTIEIIGVFEKKVSQKSFFNTLLGPVVKQTINPLAKLAIESKSDDAAIRAIYALADIGSTNVVPPLLFCLTNGPSSRRSVAADSLQYMDREVVVTAIPALVARLKDADPEVARCAAYSLGRLKLAPDLVVPALAEATMTGIPILQTHAELALEDYGPAAEVGIPALLALCSSTNKQVQWYATNALHAIAPETYTNTSPPLRYVKRNGQWVTLYSNDE